MKLKDKIKTFTLASLLGASPLSSNAQSNTDDISTEAPIELATPISKAPDYNKYTPYSESFYHFVCQNGIEILSNNDVPEELKTLYQNFIKFYEENKEKEIDLNDPMVRKSFLAFKKIAKYDALNDFGAITPSVAQKRHDMLKKYLANSEEYNQGKYDEFSKTNS